MEEGTVDASQVISKPLRKKYLNLLMASFVLDILLLLVFITACVFKYMSLSVESTERVQLILATVFDIGFLLCLLFYLFALKMKSVLALVLDWLLATISLVARIVLVLRVDVGIQKIPIADWVVLGCVCIEVILLVFTTSVWRKVPDRKWLKKFDMTHRMTIVEKQPKSVEKGKHTRLRRFSDEQTNV